MASISPYGKKRYRAQIFVMGVRDSQVFDSKREAQNWAAARETDIRQQAGMPLGEKHTFADALTRYKEEVSPTKRGRRWEEVRIEKFLRDTVLPVQEKIARITPAKIGEWRDQALTKVSPGTVLRELGLLSAVFETARREWGWIDINPVRDIRKPRHPDHREVLITRPQIKAMLREMGYRPDAGCRSVSQAVAAAFLMALRTGMRAGEICGLTWAKVFPDHCKTSGKTQAATRDVPITPKTRRLIEQMRGYDPKLVFGISTASLDAMFRKYRGRAGLEGFTFHDTRHTAATWIVKWHRVDVLTLCKIMGWSDPKMAMKYYNPKPKDVLEMMSGKRRT